MADFEKDDLEFAPGVKEQIDKLTSANPAAAEEIQQLFATLRQAQQALKDGKYASMDDALKALFGDRATRVDEFDLDDDLEE